MHMHSATRLVLFACCVVEHKIAYTMHIIGPTRVELLYGFLTVYFFSTLVTIDCCHFIPRFPVRPLVCACRDCLDLAEESSKPVEEKL